MSANCAPIYNFYNCCCEGKPATDPKGTVSGFFVWPVDNALHPEPKSTLDPIYSAGLPITIDTDKKGFVGLQPLHRKARLVEISVLRVFLLSRIDIPSAYSGTVFLDVLVMDLFGNTLRTISSAPVDYKSLSEKVWAPVALTALASDLEIQAAEIVIARVTFSAPDLAFPNNIRLQPAFSAIGEFI
ncbi:MAG TPA: hypothetical protein VGW39_06140 [Chthoniobacterales bacterium]|nr:hypothetical protein [Chthoniobacterales bacterium]